MTVYLGTSGWQYDDWRGRFYPQKMAKSRWRDHYAARFRTVEVNNTFYRLPEKHTFEAWRQGTPDDFVFAVKASRYLTHIRRLRDPADSVALFMERAVGLGDKLSVVLIQLPPHFKAERQRLIDTLAAFPRQLRLAVEFRDDSWFTDPIYETLAAHDAALCLADRGSRPITPVWRTASWGYVRFHEGTASPRPCYGPTALQSWAERIAELWGEDGDSYVYFNNDPRGCAVRDARLFAAAATSAGLTVTRVPEATETAVG